MARNNPKPTEKPDFIPDDTTNIETPSGSVKTNGWTFGIKPPAEYFNWFWNLLSRYTDYFGAQVEDWIVIDTDADEGDYVSFRDYLDDSPTSGDNVFIKSDETVNEQMDIPSGINIKMLKGIKFSIPTVYGGALAPLRLQGDNNVENINLEFSHTGVFGIAVQTAGDNVIGDINIANISTGTLTKGFIVADPQTGHRISGIVTNTGGGTITQVFDNNSTKETNVFSVIDDENDILFSTSVTTTATQTLTNKTINGDNNTLSNLDHGAEVDNPTVAHGATGAIVGTTNSQSLTNKTINGDVNTLSNLDHGAEVDNPSSGVHGVTGSVVGTTDAQALTNKTITTTAAITANGGIQTDGTNVLKTKVIDIGDWNMNSTVTKQVTHGLTLSNIRSVDVIIRDDAGTTFSKLDRIIGAASSGTNGSITTIDATDVDLTRFTTGLFDGTDYDATSYNRGWVTITYIA